MEDVVYISNLNYNLKEEDLFHIFNKMGEITHIFLFKNKKGESKGRCLIKYMHPNDALNAISFFDKKIIGGRLIHLKFDNKKYHINIENFSLENLKIDRAKFINSKESSISNSNVNSCSSSNPVNFLLNKQLLLKILKFKIFN